MNFISPFRARNRQFSKSDRIELWNGNGEISLKIIDYKVALFANSSKLFLYHRNSLLRNTFESREMMKVNENVKAHHKKLKVFKSDEIILNDSLEKVYGRSRLDLHVARRRRQVSEVSPIC